MTALIELSGFALIKISAGIVVAANESATGLLLSITLGKDWKKCLQLDDPVEALRWLGSSRLRALPLSARCENGRRWLRLRAHGCDEPTEWVISLEDATEERRETERANLEADHFHALIERSAEGISLFDATSKILYESPSNKRIHGYDAHEMEGLTLIDFCHPEDAARIALRFKHLAEAPGVIETEIVRFRHKAGHYIYLEGTVLNATDDPRLGALVNNFREVTGRLDAERELRRAKTAAEEAQRLQQHFLTNLSHEFKTPLTLIRGPMETLASDAALGKKHRRTLVLALRNVERLDALLTELIDLAHLDAAAFSLKAQQRDLGRFVRHQVELFAAHAAEKDITLRCETPDECQVFFDGPKLEKVLGNLISNALKFAPPETSVSVRVYERAGVAGVGEVEVAVSDQGAGMDEATRERVFERFFQGDAGRALGHEGMGIGMAVAREMVEMHGGALSVESEPGLGSTFTFTIPLGCDHLDPDDIDTGSAPPPEPRPYTIGPPVPWVPASESTKSEADRRLPRLLLVEDNLDMRIYLRMHLDLHYAVEEAGNGLAALEALEASPHGSPDIILSDVMMPQLNGLELCRKLRAEPRWREIPIVLLSAKAAVDHRVEGLRAGANDYLTKPFSIAELLERLRARLPASAWAKPPEGGWLQQLEECMEAQIGSPHFDVEELALALGLGTRQLRRRVGDHFGKSPAALILERRLERARRLIKEKQHDTIAHVAEAVGMSPGYFSRRYRNAYRCSTIEL